MQDRQVPLDLFVGRAAALASVAEVLTRVEAGQPWLVAIEGDPGVGKTALARRCLTGAAGLRVLSARAGQAETDLDFGIVDQLLRMAGGAVPAAGLTGGTGSPASSFAVGARLLEVVGEQQATGAVAIVVDDLQWADRRSVEALTFMLRRLSVDPVLAVVIYRGPSDRLDEAAQRLLLSIENRLPLPLGGLSPDEVASLAAALSAGSLNDETVQWLYRGTGGHPLYLRTLMSEGFDFDPRAPGRLALPRSLAAAIGDHLRVLPPETRDHSGDALGPEPADALGPAGPGGADRVTQRGDRTGGGLRPGGLVAGRTSWPSRDPPPARPGRHLRRHHRHQAPHVACARGRHRQRVGVLGASGRRPGPSGRGPGRPAGAAGGRRGSRRPPGVGRHPPAVGLGRLSRPGPTGNGGC